ncbi:MAG: hypothetical protein EBX50_21165 [Chitinophagia bacterium]|nr:hypothetical protein [Chitinophagia bacterium]
MAALNATISSVYSTRTPYAKCLYRVINRHFRQDVLDAYILEGLYKFRAITEEWLEDYNHHRPHESLNNLPPLKYQST